VDDEAGFYRSRPKSPVVPAAITSIITTVVVFFALRALDGRGAFSGAPKEKAPAGVTAAAPLAAVEVPAIRGMRGEQARELLKGRALLLAFSGERDSAEYPAGAIVEQTPLQGSQVPTGTVVQAVVSRGLTQAAVPKVAGLKLDDALKALAAAGLAAGPQKSIVSTIVPAGTVADSEPAAGGAVAPKTAVTLVVSTGPSAKPVPKVTGMRLRAARELLEQQGWKVGKIRYDSDGDRSSGVVLEQKPAAAAVVPADTALELTINEE
jgi:beta-lactam-binding protein with PASTA domain